jgi:hypothetical protein
MAEVNALDFTMVKQKLMDEEEGQGWCQEYTDHVEKRYRRYLGMVRAQPNGSVVPTRDIDLFWHQHILDTRAYSADCDRVFGYFLHHFPYLGMRGPDDAAELVNRFEETKVAYAHLFGEDYCAEFEDGGDASRGHKCSSKCHKCQSGCGMKCTRCTSR